MKKTTLLFFLLLTISANSQVLSSDDSSALTVGNIGTDLTGATPGQNNWLTVIGTATPVGQNSDFQIINAGGAYGNAIQIIGPSATNGTRFLFKNGLPASWASRTVGNDIIEVEFDIYTGALSTSKNSFRVYLYSDEPTSKPIAGIGITKSATVTAGTPAAQTSYQNLISGYAHYTNGATTAFYSFGLGTVAPFQVTTTDDTWVRLGFSFNKTTGQIIFKGPGINGTVPGAAAGLDPKEVDFIATAGNVAAISGFPAINNAASATMRFDNIIIRASATDTLLGLDSVASQENAISLYPNPANDLVTVSATDSSISAIEMTDMNGRIVKNNAFNNLSEIEVNISDLAQGVYLMKITSDKGTTTKKLVKE